MYSDHLTLTSRCGQMPERSQLLAARPYDTAEQPDAGQRKRSVWALPERSRRLAQSARARLQGAARELMKQIKHPLGRAVLARK